MPSEFNTTRRIEFSDTDMAGIVHFSRFFVFMEAAEHAFLRSLGTSVTGVLEGGKWGGPGWRVVRLRESRPIRRRARYQDEGNQKGDEFDHVRIRVSPGRRSDCPRPIEHGVLPVSPGGAVPFHTDSRFYRGSDPGIGGG